MGQCDFQRGDGVGSIAAQLAYRADGRKYQIVVKHGDLSGVYAGYQETPCEQPLVGEKVSVYLVTSLEGKRLAYGFAEEYFCGVLIAEAGQSSFDQRRRKEADIIILPEALECERRKGGVGLENALTNGY